METRCDFLEKSDFSKTVDELRCAIRHEFKMWHAHETRNAHRIADSKVERVRSLERPRRRWENGIKLNFK